MRLWKCLKRNPRFTASQFSRGMSLASRPEGRADRKNRDQEGSPAGMYQDLEDAPTEETSKLGGRAYGDIACIETGRARLRIYETPSVNLSIFFAILEQDLQDYQD